MVGKRKENCQRRCDFFFFDKRMGSKWSKPITSNGEMRQIHQGTGKIKDWKHEKMMWKLTVTHSKIWRLRGIRLGIVEKNIENMKKRVENYRYANMKLIHQRKCKKKNYWIKGQHNELKLKLIHYKNIKRWKSPIKR